VVKDFTMLALRALSFFIKCKYCIDQKVSRQACETSWKPTVHMNINIQAKGKQNRIAWGNSLPPSTREKPA